MKKQSNRKINIKYKELKDEINVDEIFQMSLENPDELITTTCKLGLMLADAEYEVSNNKFNIDLYMANAKNTMRDDSVGKSPSIDFMESVAVATDGYVELKEKYFESVKYRDYLKNLYWMLRGYVKMSCYAVVSEDEEE